MNNYQVDDLRKGVFAGIEKITANTPKEAAEKSAGKKVRRAINGGSIVVYAFCNAGHYRSYVYEVCDD